MDKYINVEKLKERIIKLEADSCISEYIDGFDDGVGCVLDVIDSLHQEQPKVDLVAELKHHLDTTPKEQLEKEWKELEPWGNIGPTVQEFLYGKQPEVDLEKEYTEFVLADPVYSKLVNGIVGKAIARHFYELGLKARKEE